MNLHHRSLNQTQHCFASVFPSIHWFVAFFSQEDMVLQCVIYRHPAASDTYSVKISPGSCLISYADFDMEVKTLEFQAKFKVNEYFL